MLAEVDGWGSLGRKSWRGMAWHHRRLSDLHLIPHGHWMFYFEWTGDWLLHVKCACTVTLVLQGRDES